MALLLPVLLLVVGGIIDFGRAFAAQMSITQASREGARMLAMGYTVNQAQARATGAAPGITISGFSQTTCPATPPVGAASSFTVETKFTYLMLDGLSGLFGGAIPATQTGSSQSRVGSEAAGFE